MEEHVCHLMDVIVDQDGQDLPAVKVSCLVVETHAAAAIVVWEIYILSSSHSN